jgi:hypothetical protein
VPLINLSIAEFWVLTEEDESWLQSSESVQTAIPKGYAKE